MKSIAYSLILAAALSSGACTVTNAGTNSTTDAGVGEASAPVRDTSCPGVLDCIDKCPDDACSNECISSAPTATQDALNGIVNCASANSCQDTACLQRKCEPELRTCALTSSPKPGPVDPPPATGNVPAELVGTWQSFGVLYEFNANGTLTISKRIGSGACVTTTLEKGTVVTTGNTLTAHLTEGLIKICGKPPTDPYQPITDRYEYTLETTQVGPVLRLKKLTCEYTDQASIDFYCTASYDKT
jgi:hypothetical protein